MQKCFALTPEFVVAVFVGVKQTFCEPFLLHLNNLIASADEVQSRQKEGERGGKKASLNLPLVGVLFTLLFCYSFQFNLIHFAFDPSLSLSLSFSSAISFQSARVWASEILFYLIFPSPVARLALSFISCSIKIYYHNKQASPKATFSLSAFRGAHMRNTYIYCIHVCVCEV